MLASAVGPGLVDLANHIMHFCAHTVCFCHSNSFCMHILLVLRFFSVSLMLFPLSNNKISDTLILLVSLLHFEQCFDMCCAQLFVCLFALFCAFWLCMINAMVALFFAILLDIASFIFVVKLFTFALFVFCRFSRCHFLIFIVFLAAQFASFCVAGCPCLPYCATTFFLHCFIFSCWFFHSLCTVVVLLIFFGLYQFAFVGFGVFFALIHIFCLLHMCYRHTKLTHTPFFADIPLTSSHVSSSRSLTTWKYAAATANPPCADICLVTGSGKLHNQLTRHHLWRHQRVSLVAFALRRDDRLRAVHPLTSFWITTEHCCRLSDNSLLSVDSSCSEEVNKVLFCERRRDRMEKWWQIALPGKEALLGLPCWWHAQQFSLFRPLATNLLTSAFEYPMHSNTRLLSPMGT